MAKKYRKKTRGKKPVRGKRANTKLLTILGVSLACVLFGLGGLWFFVEYRSAGRNASAGDSLIAAGKFNEARKQYGRAITKEPNNIDYVNKLQEAILNITPVTQEEARALYDEYVGTMMHKARYSPNDIDVQLEIVDEMYYAAYKTGSSQYWQRLHDSAQLGLDRIAPEDPRRHELMLYRGLSALYLEDANVTETYDENGNAMFPGENDIKAVLEEDPGNVLAWATLAHGRMAIYYRMLNEGRTQQAARNKLFADETMEQALAVAGDSFEVNVTFLREMLLKQNVLRQAYLNDPNSVTEDELKNAEETVLSSQQKLVDSFQLERHEPRVPEVVSLLISAGVEGQEKAIELLQDYLEDRPNDVARHHMLAVLLIEQGQYEDAIIAANKALDVPQQTVGLKATEQFIAKPVAARALVQSAIGLANSSENDAERDSYIADAKKYRVVLADYLSNNEDHPILTYADGVIALAEKDYQKAVQLLERVISKIPDSTAQVYRESAIALEQTGSRGIAIERMATVIQTQPTVLSNYLMKAQLEMLNKDYVEAGKTLSVLSPDAKARPEVAELLNIIALNLDSGNLEVTDERLGYLKQIDQLIQDKSYEQATQLVDSLIEQDPEDWRFYAAKSNVFIAQDNVEDGLVMLKQALELNPESDVIRQRVVLLESANPIDAYISYVNSQDLPEADMYSQIAIHCFDLARNKSVQANMFERSGFTDRAREARELAELAEAKSIEYQELLKQVGGDLTTLTLVRFEKALQERSIDEANALLDELSTTTTDEVLLRTNKVRTMIAEALIAKGVNQDDVYQAKMESAMALAQAITNDVPYSDSGWWVLGIVYQELDMMGEAVGAFGEAYRIDSKNSENIQRYLGALFQSGEDPQRTLRIARMAIEQHPLNTQFTEMWLEIEAQHGDLSKVIQFRIDALERRPEELINALSLAYVLVNATPSYELILDDKNERKYTHRAWNQLTAEDKASELSALQNSWNLFVSSILDHASKTKETNARIAFIHASIARDIGQLDRASEIWDDFIDSEVGSDTYSESVIAAANFMQLSNRFEQAVTILTESLEVEPSNIDLQAALGSLYHLGGRHEEAVELLEAVAEKSDEASVIGRLIEAYVYTGRFDDAENTIGRLNTSDDSYGRAMLKAMISRVKSSKLLAQGDLQSGRAELIKYRNALREAINIDPTKSAPYIFLCKTLLNEYRLTQDEALLEEAIQVADEGENSQASSEDFAVVRTDVLQADGQIHRAIDRLSRHLAEHPEADVVRQRLIEAYLDTEENEKAISVAQAGITENPSNPSWYQRLGDLHMRANDDATLAVKMYLEALQRDPTVSKLLKLDEMTRTDQLMPDRQILSMTQGVLSRSHPIIGAIEAKALNNLERRRDALLAMNKSWLAFQTAIDNGWLTPNANANWFLNLAELFKDSPEEGVEYFGTLNDNPTAHDHIGLATYYESFGGEYESKAIELLEEVAANTAPKSPERARALMLLGGFLVTGKRYEESEVVFKQLSEEQDSPLILNNLAYVVGVYLNRPEDGIKIALEAAERAPHVPSIIDTVAKLHIHLGEPQKAAETYAYLLQIDPANVNAMTQLALLYAAELNDADRAIVYAERARSQSPRSPEVLDALGWSYYRAGRDAKGEEFLQLSIKRGDTASAYLHIAQVLMDNGKYEKALGELRIAEELAQDAHSRNRIQAVKDDIRKKQSDSGS
ncbi:MAG: hypothetical protein CMJ38_01690 [Phycisphaerae bacterium]|nr:hypothetical protein [Phycisphaerae bacterium]